MKPLYWILGAAGALVLFKPAKVARAYFKNKQDFVFQTTAAVRRVAPEFGLPPKPTDVFVTAHAAISSGWGGTRKGTGVGGYNLWGMKAGKRWTGDTFMARGFENVGGQRVYGMMKWKAFPSLDAAIREHLTMVSRQAFADSFAKLKAGDYDYMAQLGRDGWYTAETDEVDRMWQSIVQTIKRMIATVS